MLGSFKPESLLYNLKKDIKVDRSDFGQTTQNKVKTLEDRVKVESGRQGLAPGKTLVLKGELLSQQ